MRRGGSTFGNSLPFMDLRSLMLFRANGMLSLQAGKGVIVYRRELQKTEDPEKLRHEKVEEFRERFANPYVAAERGYVDAVIEPHDTRPKLIAALRMFETKRDANAPKKHGNIPV